MCAKLKPAAGGGASPAALPAPSRQLRASNCCCHLPHPHGGRSAQHTHGTARDEGSHTQHAAQLCPEPPRQGSGKPAAKHGAAALLRGHRGSSSFVSPEPPAAQGAAAPPAPRRSGDAAACPRCPAAAGPVRGEGAARRGRDAGGAPEDPREGGKLQPVPGAPLRSPAPG